MKKVFSLLTLLLFYFAFSQINVKVEVRNIKNIKGDLSIDFYKNVENYTEGVKAFKSLYVPVDHVDQYEVFFNDVEDGFYAVKAFLDVNGNKKLDKSFLGIRKEPYGFSGKQNPLLREPTFEEAKVYISKNNSSIVIDLNNKK